MYVANTTNYPGAYEKETLDALIRGVADHTWDSEEELTAVFQFNDDDIEIYVSDTELDRINREIQEYREMIKINIRDTEFYNQETRMLIYDRI